MNFQKLGIEIDLREGEGCSAWGKDFALALGLPAATRKDEWFQMMDKGLSPF